jgi:hypothetical protein
MNHKILKIKAFLLRKMLKFIGFVFGFGSISFLTMCAKYGDIANYYGTIKGKVTSSVTGEIIKNIEIDVKENSILVTTDDLGNYLVDRLEPQTYTVEAKDIDGTLNGDFKNASKTIILNPEEIVNCDFVLDPK